MGAVKPLLAAPATPVRLDIRDLLALETVPEESMKHINNLVLRFNTELKGVYRHYSQVRREFAYERRQSSAHRTSSGLPAGCPKAYCLLGLKTRLF